MTGSEKMQLTAAMLVESAQLAKDVILNTAPDETLTETSMAYFAGQVGAILVVAKRLEEGVNRIHGWQLNRLTVKEGWTSVPQTVPANEAN